MKVLNAITLAISGMVAMLFTESNGFGTPDHDRRQARKNARLDASVLRHF